MRVYAVRHFEQYAITNIQKYNIYITVIIIIIIKEFEHMKNEWKWRWFFLEIFNDIVGLLFGCICVLFCFISEFYVAEISF